MRGQASTAGGRCAKEAVASAASRRRADASRPFRPPPVSATRSATLRPVVARVAGAQPRLFRGRDRVALAIGSLALIADSLDFLEDAAINLLIFAGIGWSVRNRARLGSALAAS